MKFTPEVIAALAVLRDNADNDFERHRIDILERDLTNPPVVVQETEHIQNFLGRKYYENQAGRFCTNDMIHRTVYEYYVGAIPSGYQIHHIDGNPANNSIGNLLCLTEADHKSLHRAKTPMTIARCVVCKKTFKTRKLGGAKYCSKACQRAGRRASGIDNIEKICPICGKKFTCNRYEETFTCSAACGRIFRKSHEEKISRTCPYCGKQFETPKNNPAQYCSRLCRQRHYRQTNKEERICVVCGKTFLGNRDSDAKTCSYKCRAAVIWQTRKSKG